MIVRHFYKIISLLLFLNLFSCTKELNITDFADDYINYESELKVEAVILPTENTAIVRIDKSFLLTDTLLYDCIDDDFGIISKAYSAKKKSLHQMVTNHHARQQQITLAKRRAITEVKALATALRKRFEAEERAMTAVLRKIREENPDYADQALSQAAAAAEKLTGEAITETENLPLLSKTVDLSYIDPVRRNEQHPKLPAKLTSPIRPTTSTSPEVNSGFPFIQPHNPASLKEAAKLEALIAYKKQAALDHARQAKQQTELSQASSSKEEKTRKLRELVDLYVSEKISPREYYHRRELILGTTIPQDKK